MKISRDEKQLLEILQIKNLESVELKDLFQSSVNGQRLIVPGFIITYDEPLKMMYRTSLDKYFDDYVRVIKEVYLDEKDHIIRTGIRGDEYISIDPISKAMLINGDLDNKDTTYNYYKNIEGYQESLLFEEDELKSKLPILEYHLIETLKTMGLTMSNVTMSSGMNGVYYLKTTINNKPVKLPIYYEKVDDIYKVTVSNIIGDSIPITLEMNISDRGIDVLSKVNEFNYYDYSSFKVVNDKVIKNREVYFQNKIMHSEHEILKEVKDDTIPKKWAEIEDEKKMKWYHLPFEGYIGINKQTKGIAEDGTLTDIENEHLLETKESIILVPTQESVYLRDFSTKTYYKKVDDRTISQKVTLDAMDKTMIGIIKDNNVLLETSFGEDGVSGFYKKYLEGKYFYQTAKINDIKGTITKLERKDGIEEKTDLLEESFRKR